MVTVLALNYLHSGGSFPPLASLRRPPNAAQAKAFSYLERLVRACGAVESIDVPSASRRSSELIARLAEVSDHLTGVGSSVDAYGPALPGLDIGAAAAHDALRPFRNLDASRLVLTGRGQWDAAKHLDDPLYLAYVEPDSPCFDLVLGHHMLVRYLLLAGTLRPRCFALHSSGTRRDC